jgi:hypothetical protein
MDKLLITVMQKGMLDPCPKLIKTRASYIANQMKYGFFHVLPFDPVEGVMLAIETQGKYSNFTYDEELIRGLVVFYRGTKDSFLSLTEQQKVLIPQWFITEHHHGK